MMIARNFDRGFRGIVRGKSRFGSVIFCCMCAGVVPVYGQDSSSAKVPEEGSTGIHRLAIGFRIAGYPFNMLANHDVNVTSADSSATYGFTTSNSYLQAGFGPSLEFAVTRRFTVSAEAFYHRLSYTMTDTATVGSDVTTVAEQTSARLYDIPVMLRYRKFEHVYFSGGGSLRKAANVRTTNNITYPDGATSSNNNTTTPSRTNLPGAVVGVGLRFVDDFHIKVEPEIRYTRWMGETFDSESTRSRRNQIELDLAFTF